MRHEEVLMAAARDSALRRSSLHQEPPISNRRPGNTADSQSGEGNFSATTAAAPTRHSAAIGTSWTEWRSASGRPRRDSARETAPVARVRELLDLPDLDHRDARRREFRGERARLVHVL